MLRERGEKERHRNNREEYLRGILERNNRQKGPAIKGYP